jgi:hypothetical protein
MITDAYKMSFHQCPHRCSYSHCEEQRPQLHYGRSLISHILPPECWTSDVFTSNRLGSYCLSSCMTYTYSSKVYANSFSHLRSSFLNRIYEVCCADFISNSSLKLILPISIILLHALLSAHFSKPYHRAEEAITSYNFNFGPFLVIFIVNRTFQII